MTRALFGEALLFFLPFALFALFLNYANPSGTTIFEP